MAYTESKYCLFCGKGFIPKNKRQKYCSNQCGKGANKLRFQLKHHYIKKCPSCNKEFTTTNSQKKYCCFECQQKAVRIRHKKEFDAFENCSMEELIKMGKATPLLKIRWQVLRRDDFTCQYCGRNVRDDGVKLEIDHIFPESKGGKTVFSNLITACKECNSGKSDCILKLRELKRLKLL